MVLDDLQIYLWTALTQAEDLPHTRAPTHRLQNLFNNLKKQNQELKLQMTITP